MRKIFMRGLVTFSFVVVLMVYSHSDVVAQSQNVAGEVTRLQGTVEAVQPGSSRTLKFGDKIFVRDSIETGTNTRIQIIFRDGSDLILGEETIFAIDTYIFDDSGNSGTTAFTLVAGVFRLVTGAIASRDDPSVTIKTPLATIGIRGTDLWGAQRPNRLRVGMFGGIAVIVTTAGGTVTLTDPETLTIITSPDVAPTPIERFDPDDLAQVLTTIEF
jgi:hypothetical protein